MTEEPIGPERLHSHLQELQARSSGRLAPEDLEAVATSSGALGRFLDKKIIGTIRWHGGIGRPTSATLAEAFIIRHQAKKIDLELGPEGPVDVSHPVDADPPVTWDGADGDETLSVGFLCDAHLEDYLSVGLAEGVSWEDQDPRFAGAHRVEPPTATVQLGDSRFATVEFEVARQISPERHRLSDS